MRLIGQVLHSSKNSRLVLRTDCVPKGNERVYTEGGEPIGRVAEVFGPVKKPFVSVKPFKNVNLEKIIGEKIFTK
ncbi:MAG: Gar1/Naf1 family protein [archaeon]